MPKHHEVEMDSTSTVVEVQSNTIYNRDKNHYIIITTNNKFSLY